MNGNSMYFYEKNTKENIKYFIKENNIKVTRANKEEIAEMMRDTGMLYDDSITGAQSQSYTMNRYDAYTFIWGNENILQEMEYCGLITYKQIGELLANADYEKLDVMIRCFIADTKLEEALEEYLNEKGEAQS